MLGNLRYQTRPPDELRVYLSDTRPCEVARLREHFPDYIFSVQPNQEDWGHEKRSIGITEIDSEYLGFFNDDDTYTIDYVAKMMEEAEKGAEIVYCNWNKYPDCGFHLGNSTSGNFIVKSELARNVGWNYRVYTADGEFINGLRRSTDWITKIEEILYFHA
jgi:hypothetical protein